MSDMDPSAILEHVLRNTVVLVAKEKSEASTPHVDSRT